MIQGLIESSFKKGFFKTYAVGNYNLLLHGNEDRIRYRTAIFDKLKARALPDMAIQSGDWMNISIWLL